MTRVSNSGFKLHEAKYFLNLAKENQANYGPFLFYLSACLTATVSIVDVLRFEFKHKNEGFGKWFKVEEKKLNEAGFDKLKLLRNEIVHKAGSILDKIERDHVVPFASGGLSYEQNSKWVLQFNSKAEGLFDICEHYIVLLSKIVEYCEDNFKWYDEEEEIPDDFIPDEEMPEDEIAESKMLEDDEVSEEETLDAEMQDDDFVADKDQNLT